MELKNINFEDFSTMDMVELYSKIIKTLKARGVMRTKNFIGEVGEHIVIDYYNNTPSLDNLLATEIGTKGIDAVSRKGKRYTIKSVSSNATSVFYGLEPPDSDKPDEKLFEYVVICLFDNDYGLKGIYELTWEQFQVHKRWHPTMQGWKLQLNRSLLADAKTIYKRA
ncbi:hypothetical protein QTL86_16760 [Cellulosilyticum sp. ST5]|uniref:hypothetical protein n=1 Tax=Cellulosilyticum sp. ST5 TaxID=3055805 RepID=UPI0039775522